jgi:hypothetical protein
MGEPPVAYFSQPLLDNPRPSKICAFNSSPYSKQPWRNFFLFIRRLFGIRHDSGGNLSIRQIVNLS